MSFAEEKLLEVIAGLFVLMIVGIFAWIKNKKSLENTSIIPNISKNIDKINSSIIQLEKDLALANNDTSHIRESIKDIQESVKDIYSRINKR